MNETVETITAVQALGVALSIPAGTMTMGECQDAAPAMLEHLQAMGFDIVQRELARALAESEKRVKVLEETVEAMSGDAADLTDLIGEAAAMRTVLGHLLGNDRGRIHDSGCGVCDAGRALLTAEHELPSYRALSEPETPR